MDSGDTNRCVFCKHIEFLIYLHFLKTKLMTGQMWRWLRTISKKLSIPWRWAMVQLGLCFGQDPDRHTSQLKLWGTSVMQLKGKCKNPVICKICWHLCCKCAKSSVLPHILHVSFTCHASTAWIDSVAWTPPGNAGYQAWAVSEQTYWGGESKCKLNKTIRRFSGSIFSGCQWSRTIPYSWYGWWRDWRDGGAWDQLWPEQLTKGDSYRKTSILIPS